MLKRWICSLPTVTALSLIGLAAASPAAGQFAQYTPPGGPGGPPESRQEALDGAVEDARWRLGPLRLEPWIGVKDVGWVDNVGGTAEEPESDLSATAGAGLRAYLPMGGKTVWAAHLLPEYVWWADNDQLNRLNGRYGVGWFGFFNRLTVEATATRSQLLGIATSELLRRTSTRSDEVGLSTELRLAGSLYLFAGGSETRVRNLDEPQPGGTGFDLALLDRDETVVRGGLRWRSRGGWVVGVGAEDSDVEFVGDGLDRSNSGTAPVFEILNPGARLFVSLNLAWRSLEPREGAQFTPYDGVTGSLQLGAGEELRFQPTLYASRNLVYALDAPFSYFEDDRVGVSLTTQLGWRTSLGVFAEAGVNDYVADAAGSERRDDLTAFGASLGMTLWRSIRLELGYSREEFDSNLAGADRTVSSITAGLRLGSGLSPWY